MKNGKLFWKQRREDNTTSRLVVSIPIDLYVVFDSREERRKELLPLILKVLKPLLKKHYPDRIVDKERCDIFLYLTKSFEVKRIVEIWFKNL